MNANEIIGRMEAARLARKRKQDLEGIAIIACGVIACAVLFFAQVYAANCSRGYCHIF